MKYFAKSIIISAMFLFEGCVETNRNDLYRMNGEFKRYAPKNKDEAYWLIPEKKHTHIMEDWADSVLYELQEPVLNQNIGLFECVRFTWLPTFDASIVVRVNNFEGNVFANIKALRSFSDRDNLSPLVVDTIVKLNIGQWKDIIHSLNINSFWNIPYRDTLDSGQDGITWFLECNIGNHYKVVERWDDGYLNSEETKKYLDPLISFAKNYVSFASRR